jgi:hypothetical protein
MGSGGGGGSSNGGNGAGGDQASASGVLVKVGSNETNADERIKTIDKHLEEGE